MRPPAARYASGGTGETGWVGGVLMDLVAGEAREILLAIGTDDWAGLHDRDRFPVYMVARRGPGSILAGSVCPGGSRRQ